MGVKYLKDGEDFTFSFDPAFGFTGSAKGRHDAREHPQPDDGEYGDGSYVQNKAKGGRVKKLAMGGPMVAPVGARPGMPVNTGMARPGPVAPTAMPRSQMAAAAPAPMQGIPAMAKGGKFIQKGIKHPGRMKNLAKEHGRSLHDELEHDKHSSSKSLRSAAVLGLRFTEGDLSHHRKKR